MCVYQAIATKLFPLAVVNLATRIVTLSVFDRRVFSIEIKSEVARRAFKSNFIDL